MKKQNCWEYLQCGKQGALDNLFEEVGTCPAATEICLDGVNDGKNAGRACWGVTGTLCGHSEQGDYASKIGPCLKCEFYQLVQSEEGNRLVTGSELMEMLQYREAILRDRAERQPTLSADEVTDAKTGKLTRSTLITRLAAEMASFTDPAISRRTRTEIARRAVNRFFDSIKQSLQAGDRVDLRGFGTFAIKHYRGYTGRNPKTGEPVEVKPKRLAVFRPGKALKTAVTANEKPEQHD